MNIHQNARLTPVGRERMVRQVLIGMSFGAVAQANGVSMRTVRKWMARFEAEGVAGLQDRSSRPHKLNRPTPSAIVDTIIELRRQRLTGKHVARRTGVSATTVSRVLRRAGLSRMKDLEPRKPEHRYEHKSPGDMIHLDIKKFGKFDRPGHRVTGNRTGQSSPRSRPQGGYGWEYLHVCIDDASRVAFTDIFPNEKKESAVAFLTTAVAYYRKLGVTITRVMTEFKGSGFDPVDQIPRRTAAVTNPMLSPKPVKHSSSDISAPSPILHAQMERQNASSKPQSGNGPMQGPIRPPTSARDDFPNGHTCTIGTGLMQE